MGKPRGQHVPQRILGDPSLDRFGFPALVEAYATDRAVRRYSEEYIRVDRGYLAKCAAWLATQGVTHPSDVTKSMLEGYQGYLHDYAKPGGGHLTLTTQGAAIGPVRRFYLWGTQEGRIAADPTVGLQVPRREQRPPRAVLTRAEAERVLAAPDVSQPRGLRDRAILEVLYSTGIRRGELARLRFADLDHERQTLSIRQAKGHKDRIIPIGSRALDWVDRYTRDARPRLDPLDKKTVFLSSDGYGLTPHRLSQLVGGYVDRAAIFKHGGCHLFRHTLATLMLDSGADIRYVQAMLGHASLTSTQIYTHVSMTALRAVHTATFADPTADPS